MQDRPNIFFSDSPSGFTLVEMMISVFIFTLITGATFIVLNTGRNTWQAGSAQIQAQEEVRRGIYSMTRELRQSQSTQLSGVPADSVYYTNPIIIFRKPTNVSGGETVWSSQIQYCLDTTDANSDGVTDQLVRISDSTATLLANKITQLRARRTATNLLWVELTAQVQTTDGRTLSNTSEAQVMFRN